MKVKIEKPAPKPDKEQYPTPALYFNERLDAILYVYSFEQSCAKGIVLSASDPSLQGSFSTFWDKAQLALFEGKVILENE